MIICDAKKVNTFFNSIELYVSRAYRSNQIFVYQLDHSDEKLYLEKLMTRISIVDNEPGFEDVED